MCIKVIKEKTSKMRKAVINATKKSSIAEHLIKNIDYATNYYL